MRTRSSDAPRGGGLPPPPAPTSRDANPWSYTGSPEQPRRRAPANPLRPAPGQRRPLRLAPLAVLLFILGAGVQFAVRALREQDLEAALAAVAIVAMVGFILWRRTRRVSP